MKYCFLVKNKIFDAVGLDYQCRGQVAAKTLGKAKSNPLNPTKSTKSTIYREHDARNKSGGTTA